jgi:hypothetical protein
MNISTQILCDSQITIGLRICIFISVSVSNWLVMFVMNILKKRVLMLCDYCGEVR